MNTSTSGIVKELHELSGLTVPEFCQRLNITTDDFSAWASDEKQDSPSFLKLIKAVGVTLASRRDMDHCDRVDKRLSQAKAIVVTVMDSPELTEDQRLALSVATELVDTARHDVLES